MPQKNTKYFVILRYLHICKFFQRFSSVLIQPEKIYATNWASIENMEFEPDYNQSSCQKAVLKPFIAYFDVKVT